MTDAALIAAFEATWPAAEVASHGAVRSGRGFGAGGRVSSSTVGDAWTEADLRAAEAQHRQWQQAPMFRVYDDQPAVLSALAGRGYVPTNPTAILSAPLARLTGRADDPMAGFAVWPPLAIQRDIWTEGGIGASRQAVMGRVAGPKTAFLGRLDDRASAASFVAVHGPVAMTHALQVRPAFRRRGMGGILLRKAAAWAADHGADRMGLAVSLGNTAATALYAQAGFVEAARYAYLVQPQG